MIRDENFLDIHPEIFDLPTTATPIEVRVDTAETAETADTADTADTAILASELFSEDIYSNLPDLLKSLIEPLTSGTREKDIVLLTAYGMLSGIFPTVQGLYHNRTVYPNLFLLITAPPASGKGVMSYVFSIVDKIHNELLDESKNASRIAMATNKDSNKKQRPPALKKLKINPNISQSALIDGLAANDGVGIICSTEADSILNTWDNKWANYSDDLRKAFSHEPLGYERKTDREMVQIDTPKLSVVISGTPNQLKGLFKEVENGMFSRFLNYIFTERAEWQSPAPTSNSFAYGTFFKGYQQRVYDLYKNAKSSDKTIDLTSSQWERFNNVFSSIMEEYPEWPDEVIKRHGLMCYKLCMINTLLRNESGLSIFNNFTCSDDDFETSINLIRVLLEYSIKADKLVAQPRFHRENNADKIVVQPILPRLTTSESNILDSLPCNEEISTKDLGAFAPNMPPRTLRDKLIKWISYGVMVRVRKGYYQKKCS